MTKEEAAKQYWKWSQHYHSLPQGERENFLVFSVAPTIAASTCMVQRAMLSRLMSRSTSAVTTG